MVLRTTERRQLSSVWRWKAVDEKNWAIVGEKMGSSTV